MSWRPVCPDASGRTKADSGPQRPVLSGVLMHRTKQDAPDGRRAGPPSQMKAMGRGYRISGAATPEPSFIRVFSYSHF